jgi:hypothetical protein
MILTHNVNDIETGVRRLCQSKLYLKQASDVAAVASKDLVFTYANEDDVAQKLKLLDSRVGAFSYITKTGAERITQDTVFVRTKEYDNASTQVYENPLDALIKNSALTLPSECNTTIRIEANKMDEQACRLAASICTIKFRYLGETIAEHAIEPNKEINQPLLCGKMYKLQILDRRGRIMTELSIKASSKKLVQFLESHTHKLFIVYLSLF